MNKDRLGGMTYTSLGGQGNVVIQIIFVQLPCLESLGSIGMLRFKVYFDETLLCVPGLELRLWAMMNRGVKVDFDEACYGSRCQRQ